MKRGLVAAAAAVCLFIPSEIWADHETPGGGDRPPGSTAIGYEAPEAEVPPMPKNAAKHAKDATDVAKASTYYIVYTGSGERAPGTYKEAFDACNGHGDRLPTLAELKALVAKGRINDSFKDGCMWSATERKDGKLSMYWFDKKTGDHGTGWAERGASCGIMCLRPADPVQDTVDLCPVGAMNYCVSGKGKITNCEGKVCTPDFRCICGDFSVAYGRCLRKKMAKKSWQVYSYCTKNGKQERHHATNVIRTPYTASAHIKRFCAIEPQRAGPGGNPVLCCWVQDQDEPRVPGYCQQAYCPAGGEPYVQVQPEGTSYYDDDYADNPSCMTHFQYQTGIDGLFLTK